jgi:drug/metabolite transporter (DMT)-like permease
MFGNVSDLWRPLSPMLGVMAVSALLCIAIAHSCYYAALRHVTAVVSVSMLQAMPVLVCLFSALVYGDRLSLLQIFGGAVVIFGAWLAAMAQARVPEP